jgi:hypothetical protein
VTRLPCALVLAVSLTLPAYSGDKKRSNAPLLLPDCLAILELAATLGIPTALRVAKAAKLEECLR